MAQDIDAGLLIQLLMQILADDYPECRNIEKRFIPKSLIAENNPVFEEIKDEPVVKTVQTPEAEDLNQEPEEDVIPLEDEKKAEEEKKDEEDELWLSNLKASIRAEILNEKAVKRSAYLVRRKKDEIISLSKDVFIIGKIPEFCDYVIADNPAISRLHSIIRYNEAADEYSIIDCDTTNHTYLNGRRIEPEHAEILKDQMIIHMASEEFHFRR